MNTSSNDSNPESKTNGASDESTKTPTDKQPDSHPETASRWIQSAMKGIKEMHENEEIRKEIADRLF